MSTWSGCQACVVLTSRPVPTTGSALQGFTFHQRSPLPSARPLLSSVVLQDAVRTPDLSNPSFWCSLLHWSFPSFTTRSVRTPNS
ncbi:hypothetical protein CALCODRAFT_492107 [Calocera cornea HHB12733]|uniref:Uncharacterized protein n=1 Tax=Calocera cornea HHB12733 TaxID=1353952 RepID=A0A165IPD9_9BASI|nr:hypothetical protein CALCODRAFT_492107 [Calocera cornea HHB12733]